MMESPDHSKWDDNGNTAQSGRDGPSVALIVALVLLAVAVIWFFQNGDTVEITFLFGTWTTKVRWAIIISIGVGLLLDRLVSYGLRRRKRNKQAD
ncbi:MAG: LapA family protein [Ilumatobacteraceae bacterium]